MAAATCPKCDSSSPRRLCAWDGRCGNVKGCNARRCAKRKADDGKRGVTQQCLATIGQRSIRFCELREGHDGLHLHGTKEWGGDYSHPIAEVFRR